MIGSRVGAGGNESGSSQRPERDIGEGGKGSPHDTTWRMLR